MTKYTVQLTGNVARRHSRVPQWTPLRGPNADMPRTRPENNCVDKHQPREYFTRQQGPCKDQPAPRPAEHSSLHPIVASHLRTI